MILYRYRQLNDKTIESLCQDKLFFSNPVDFNDPLDCRPVVEADTKKSTLQNILKELITHRVARETQASLRKANIDVSQMDEHSKHVADLAASNETKQIAYAATDPDYECSAEEAECWILTNKIQDELLRRYEYGVCCFSSTCDNPLLWSHYGDQHRGVCIGYTPSEYSRERIEKVEYGGSRKIPTSLIKKAILCKNEEALTLLDRNTLFRKAPSWSYEGEWRMIGERGLHDSTLIMKDVTFGLRCSDAFKYVLYMALKSRENLQFFEMCEVHGSFDLTRVPLDAGEMCAHYPVNNHSIMELLFAIPTQGNDEEVTNKRKR